MSDPAAEIPSGGEPVSGMLPEPSSDGDQDDEQLEDDLDPRMGARDDWASAMQEVRRRKQDVLARDELAADDDLSDDDHDDHEKYAARKRTSNSRLWRTCIVALVLLVMLGGMQLWFWLNPQPLTCDVELVRPQKFKVDVTDFFAPKVSAAIQLVLNVRNSNFLRSMLLEQCKLTAFEASTGLKLGSTQQGSLVVSPFTTTKVTISLQQLGGGLPQPEQRRLAADFLGKKALLLTLVATASSRLPIKGSKPTTVSTNSSKRVDLSALTKEPFFQRAQAATPTVDNGKVHDVPI